MLVLSRKTGEDIYIGEALHLVVLEQTRNGTVRLGFEGPSSISIVRGELVSKRAPHHPKRSKPLSHGQPSR